MSRGGLTRIEIEQAKDDNMRPIEKERRRLLKLFNRTKSPKIKAGCKKKLETLLANSNFKIIW